ncbi:hypothetical protein [Streptosporangium sandarakinum]|uniref:hypothetical protein n=1 Tax=Streptosporangium sandarakinum TaxID=1260955 RepID=UPI0034495C1C
MAASAPVSVPYRFGRCLSSPSRWRPGKGEPNLFVFPDRMTGGDRTGKTKKNRRCRNVAWDQGQVAGYETVFVGDHMAEAYGPLPAAVG